MWASYSDASPARQSKWYRQRNIWNASECMWASDAPLEQPVKKGEDDVGSVEQIKEQGRLLWGAFSPCLDPSPYGMSWSSDTHPVPPAQPVKKGEDDVGSVEQIKEQGRLLWGAFSQKQIFLPAAFLVLWQVRPP